MRGRSSRGAAPLHIREGALFVADAHYPHHGSEFFALLEALASGRLTVPQLFLMGDIFDLLVGAAESSRESNRRAVELLNLIATNIEVHYFEGNHDFDLDSIFNNINIYGRRDQPVFMQLSGKRVGLSHGDRYATGALYDLYCALIRHPAVLRCLRPWERRIVETLGRRMAGKKICRTPEGFAAKVERILGAYPPDTELVIEGHYHQGLRIGRYLSLPSLACQKEVAVLRGGELIFENINHLIPVPSRRGRSED